MSLDPELCWRAHLARDPRFDGRFFTGVQSTGIYCRPICPARHPLRRNVNFFSCAAAAEEAGLRPCRRCRPESAPGSSAWRGSSATVERALRLIENGTLDRVDLQTLASRVGVGSHHLRRLFLRELGTTPSVIARTRRLHFARRLLVETKLGIAEIAFHSGFSSVRTFNEALRNAYGHAPGELRRKHSSDSDAPSPKNSVITLKLSYRPPLDWDETLRFLRPRVMRGIETIQGNSWRRICGTDTKPFGVMVTAHPTADALIATIDNPPAGSLADLVRRLKRVFDLDADPQAVAAVLGKDPLLSASLRARPGLRVPGAWDVFEILVRAILGQQISVAAASTLTARLIERLGVPVTTNVGGDSVQGHLFPTPAAISDTDLSVIGLPKTRAANLRGVAQKVASGELDLEAPWDPQEFERELTNLPGLGPWTARYVAMRGLGEPDSLPDADLGLLRALENAGVAAKAADLRRHAQAWRPWRAYAALHLWASLDPKPNKRKTTR